MASNDNLCADAHHVGRSSILWIACPRRILRGDMAARPRQLRDKEVDGIVPVGRDWQLLAMHGAVLWGEEDKHGENDARGGSGSVHNDNDRKEECHDKFLNLLTAILLFLFVLLCLSSLWGVRGADYAFFHVCHASLLSVVLCSLGMHYNKMIWYLGPCLMHNLGCNAPKWVEGWCNKRSYNNVCGCGGKSPLPGGHLEPFWREKNKIVEHFLH